MAPFGPAGTITVSIGGTSTTITQGTLYAGGPVAHEGTRYNVSSVSKLLTAARVVSLAHEGKLGLQDTVSQLLPGGSLIDAARQDVADAVTLADLLQHHSGLPHVPPDLDAQVAGRWTSASLLGEITQSWRVELAGARGTYRYSNFGYALLAGRHRGAGLRPLLRRRPGRVSPPARNDRVYLLGGEARR